MIVTLEGNYAKLYGPFLCVILILAFNLCGTICSIHMVNSFRANLEAAQEPILSERIHGPLDAYVPELETLEPLVDKVSNAAATATFSIIVASFFALITSVCLRPIKIWMEQLRTNAFEPPGYLEHGNIVLIIVLVGNLILFFFDLSTACTLFELNKALPPLKELFLTMHF